MLPPALLHGAAEAPATEMLEPVGAACSTYDAPLMTGASKLLQVDTVLAASILPDVLSEAALAL